MRFFPSLSSLPSSPSDPVTDLLSLRPRPQPADDELHNINLTENARHKHALELKKKGRQAGQYTGFDDDEFGAEGPGAARGVLSKYDEGFEGMKVDGFSLGEVQVGKKGKGKAAGENGDEGEGGEREKVKLSMEYTSAFFPPVSSPPPACSRSFD